MTASKDQDAPVFTKALLGWYDGNARRLPWRVLPGGALPDPYRVWLSEVMLQQTTVAAVIPYFETFTRAWPTVGDLAAADEAAVMAAWAGLGYYARARNLLKCARAVAAAGGRFPDTEEGLRALPGLGAYTAAAVAAIAFGRRAVVVDANVERVVARWCAVDDPLPGARPRIRALTDGLTPVERAGDFAQAMMDLGATICTARNPRCLLCPVQAGCAARAQGRAGELPAKAAKKPRPERYGRAFWIERDGAVWLVRRPAAGMLGAMRALPDDGWNAAGDGSGTAPFAADWRAEGQVSHVFSHFALALSISSVKLAAGEPLPATAGPGEWWPLDRLEQAGLPTLFAKAAQRAMAEREDVRESGIG